MVLGVALFGCSSSSEDGSGASSGGTGGTAGSDSGLAESGTDAGADAAQEGGSDAEPDAATDAPADGAPVDALPDAPEPPSTFSVVGREIEECPLSGPLCGGWPGDGDGPVYVYTSEQVWEGQTFERTFHVHVPSNLSGPAPLVVFLHGGTMSGPEGIATSKWDDFGDPRGADGIKWRKNTDACKANPTEGVGVSYEDGSGGACLPPAGTVTNELPYITVFPDGILDDGETSPLGKRHWEDGRVPSPGFGTDVENRDDVGFIDHVIGHLIADAGIDVDTSAIYVAGASNGGMMTQRLACNSGDPRFPSLARVAAFQATISELPEGLYEGRFGRDACADAVRGEFGMQIVLGTEIDTPDCDSYPCSSPTVPGDGRVPFGEAGGRHNVYSPDLGTVLAGPDTISFWQDAFDAGLGQTGTKAVDTIGFFTERTSLSYGGSEARLETWVTTGGGHMIGATRMDFAPVPSGWAFLSSFRRDASGTLTRVDPTWISGPK